MILGALLVAAAGAVFLVYDRIRSHLLVTSENSGDRHHLLGAIFFALALAATAGSATADRYLPAKEGSVAVLAYYAHITPLLDGSCPRYAPGTDCTNFVPPG